MSGDRKCETHIHAAAVALDGRIKKSFDLREGYDFVELRLDLGPRHSEDRAIEEDILSPGQFRVESGANFKQAGNPAAQPHAPAIGLRDAAQDLQQGRLARPVTTDNAQHFAALDLKAHITQGPELLDFIALHDLPAADEVGRLAREIAGLAGDDLAEHRVAFTLREPVAHPIALGKALGGDGNVGHGVDGRCGQIRSAKVFSVFLNRRMPSHRNKLLTPRLSQRPGQ